MNNILDDTIRLNRAAGMIDEIIHELGIEGFEEAVKRSYFFGCRKFDFANNERSEKTEKVSEILNRIEINGNK